MQINVIGAGAWGCALAVHLTLLGYSPKVYSHSAPIYTFNEMMECDFLLIAVPSVRVRGVIQRIKDFIFVSVSFSKLPNIVICSKGLEPGTHMLMSDVVYDVIPDYGNKLLILSGPSFAREVIDQKKTKLAIAPVSPRYETEVTQDWMRIQNMALALLFRECFSNDVINVSVTPDDNGIQFYPAGKNVYAIGLGIAVGLELGENFRSVLLYKSFRELSMLGKNVFPESTPDSIYGFADFMLTCNSPTSRNFMFGVEVAYDNDRKGALSRIHGVSEGLNTIKSLKHYSEKYTTNVPILDCIYRIIIKENDPISLLEAINT